MGVLIRGPTESDYIARVRSCCFLRPLRLGVIACQRLKRVCLTEHDLSEIRRRARIMGNKKEGSEGYGCAALGKVGRYVCGPYKSVK